MLLCGLITWSVPFAVAALIIPVQETNRPLFESIMPLAIVLGTLLATLTYWRKQAGKMSGQSALGVGVVWLVVSILIDFALFLPASSSFHMSLPDYLSDIGVTYLLIPLVTFGIGFFVQRSMSKK